MLGFDIYRLTVEGRKVVLRLLPRCADVLAFSLVRLNWTSRSCCSDLGSYLLGECKLDDHSIDCLTDLRHVRN